jgi:predicted RNase H-like nuclease
MIYLGVDAAWGKINETGVLALDPSGRILEAGWKVGLEQTVAWICDNADEDCLVFVDAPLIVTNEDKQRLCEKHVGQRYWRAKVSANSTNINSRHLGGVALRKALQQASFVYDDGLDGPPDLWTRGQRVLSLYDDRGLRAVRLLRAAAI